MARIIGRLPKQIFARMRSEGPTQNYVEGRETADEFDEEGIVGRYELVEKGTITIENAFVADIVRERESAKKNERRAVNRGG